MHSKQKGFVVITSKIIGYFFVLFLILFLSYGIWVIVESGLIEQTQWHNATLSWALGLFIPILFGIGVVVYMGLVISSLFPSLLITSDEIRYASILAKGEIKWDEIESITRSKSPIFSNVSYLVINPSCYHKKLMLEARTKSMTFSSNPLALTAWMDLGNKRSIKLPVVSTILRTEA